MTPWLRLVAVEAGYGRPVVGPVSLELGPGEVLGLAGPNGVGKSTLIAAILGEARVYAGRIERPPGHRLAHLPQRPIRLRELPLTGREWLSTLGVAADGLPAHVGRFIDRRLDRLSGGEHQLLTLWGVLSGAGELVLLDEPTNNLDPQHVGLAAEAIAARRATRATLVVSHDRAFLERVCTRIHFIEATVEESLHV
ncbi:MAG: ATP-binding cassette domain-containing protein [Thiobacillaceae bacterium]